MSYDTAVVFGAGAFGTSIASVLSENFKHVILKVREKETYESVKRGENAAYLPGQKLAANIQPALTWEELEGLKDQHEVQLLVNGLPSAAIHSFYSENQERVCRFLSRGTPMVSLTKGIDPDTCELPDDLFMHYFYDHSENICYLSGPSFAKEILDRQVTIVSLAGKTPETLLKTAKMLQTSYFKAMPTYDIKGVLLGGALKNVLAIAGGILEGLGFNHNTRAAMITRGIAEMLRFGKVFNARTETFYGYAGMGDLILTTTSDLSRNKTFGKEIAKGGRPSEIINSRNTTVEGYKTALAAHRVSKKYHIRTRLFDGIYQILYNDVRPEEVLRELMELPVESIE